MKQPNDMRSERIAPNVRGANQMEIIQLFGKIDFDPDYDYKSQRNYSSSEPCHPRVGGDPEK